MPASERAGIRNRMREEGLLAIESPEEFQFISSSDSSHHSTDQKQIRFHDDVMHDVEDRAGEGQGSIEQAQAHQHVADLTDDMERKDSANWFWAAAPKTPVTMVSPGQNENQGMGDLRFLDKDQVKTRIRHRRRPW
jgi:hypothetical protein